jgi:hypothetical protein
VASRPPLRRETGRASETSEDRDVDEERASEGVDHLQTAALEMIEAARAFLDVLEELAADREKVTQAVELVGSFARAAVRGGGGREAHEDQTEPSQVQHISVS